MWLFVLIVNFLSFINQWLKGFGVKEILERRWDWILTNILTIFFLTHFKILFSLLVSFLLSPYRFIVDFFWPQKNLNYYYKMLKKYQYKKTKLEKQFKKVETKQQLVLQKIQKLEARIIKQKKKREDKEGINKHE